MSSRMTSTTVYLTDEQLEGLRGAARRRRVSMAALLRVAVETILSSEQVQSELGGIDALQTPRPVTSGVTEGSPFAGLSEGQVSSGLG